MAMPAPVLASCSGSGGQYLKRPGYGPDQLYMLSVYKDQATAALMPSVGLEDTLVAALEKYGHNAHFSHPDGSVEDPACRSSLCVSVTR
jgi:hypothetical protein